MIGQSFFFDWWMMNQKRYPIRVVFFILICAVIISCGIYLFFFNPAGETANTDGHRSGGHPQVPLSGTKNKDKSLIYLYFADKQNAFLIAEEKALFHPDDPAVFGRVIIEELIKGPQGDLMRTIPKNTALNALYITQDRTAIVDLTGAAKENHPGGSQSEIMTIYSIVNSLVLNMPQVDRVKILIEGREAMTLAGHIDLRLPFKADMMLVR